MRPANHEYHHQWRLSCLQVAAPHAFGCLSAFSRFSPLTNPLTFLSIVLFVDLQCLHLVMSSQIFITTIVVTELNITGLAPLSTIFTPPADCSTRWLRPNDRDSTVYSGVALGSDVSTHATYYPQCYPYRALPTYSPGICPDGQTIAAIEETRLGVSGSGDVRRLWKAACCNSDNTINVSFDTWKCTSKFKTPFTAIVAFTTTDASGRVAHLFDITTTRPTTTTRTSGDSNQLVGTSVTMTIKNTAVLSAGTAQATPIYVLWELDDLSAFPPAYATSLASQIGVSFGGVVSITSSSSSASSLTSSSLFFLRIPSVYKPTIRPRLKHWRESGNRHRRHDWSRPTRYGHHYLSTSEKEATKGSYKCT
ncbi:hypothetical protein P153DRAFT_400660 [Dothidotthia symphoricarpi CBS 119687]|uniref:Uncharacterized protein n=1 Tax=Dothidotthia symphoricarpi CBS 119687 TaxID=1392245 RepID=A0A6A6A056_9PLEO|nr:uncharacterized protein P153DRAFT_400660 [Dothidotthia symphoricarpi CBS 119687]KAF2125180.1 hypothetical protein P153DRAFT_400660 [Dothidotthia symphoricarpi CBS 119687]